MEQAIIVIKIYHPPHNSHYRLEVELFNDFLQDIIISAHEKVFKNDLDLINLLMVGDLNFSGTDSSLLSSNSAYDKNVLAKFFKYTDSGSS